MCKFKKILLNPTKNDITTLRYLPDIERCFHKYFKYFQDDFSLNKSETMLVILHKAPFWVILDYSDRFMGFVFLDNFIGNDKKLYSAELTTCFDKKAWGSFTRYSAKFFLKKAFDEFGLYKIKAQIYPDNFRVRNLLKDCGFQYETTLKNETLRLGKPQDIEVYGLYRSYYYK